MRPNRAQRELQQIESLNKAYRVNGGKGQRVRVDGKLGRITGVHGHYWLVTFDGESVAKTCHPTWKFDYDAKDAAAPALA